MFHIYVCSVAHRAGFITRNRHHGNILIILPHIRSTFSRFLLWSHDWRPNSEVRKNIVESPVWSPLNILPGFKPAWNWQRKMAAVNLIHFLGPEPNHCFRCSYLTCLICKTIAHSTLWNIINLSVHKSQTGISEEFLADPPKEHGQSRCKRNFLSFKPTKNINTSPIFQKNAIILYSWTVSREWAIWLLYVLRNVYLVSPILMFMGNKALIAKTHCKILGMM